MPREKPHSSKTLGAKRRAEGQKCGERAGDGLVHSTGHRGSGVIFMLWSTAGEAFCEELTLRWVFFLLYSHSTCCSRLSLSQPFPMPLQHKAVVCTATLQAAPARLGLFLLWAITCWRKECGAGQGSLRALLTAPNSSEQGGAGVVSFQEHQALGERGSVCNHSFPVFQRAQFVLCCVTGVGKCLSHEGW